MTINLDIVIDTPDYSVDMKSGLISMQGCSDAVRCIAETLLTEKVPERQTSKSSVRTSLKQSFKGSYGQIFSLDVHDQQLQRKLAKIGHSAFIEVVGYFLSESLYREPSPISEKAQKVVDGLGENHEMLVQQLRVSALKNIHTISINFDRDIKIRHRISRENQTVIAQFDKNSSRVLEAEKIKKEFDLYAVITRLNIHTGNGRLQIKGEAETVAFGFEIEYKEVSVKAKKIFSENLNYNNGLPEEKWKYLRIPVSPIKLMDERVVKYIVRGIYED